MTIRELKELDDKDIRKFAYESLYNTKKLSNTNVDCFVTGFKCMRNRVHVNMSDTLQDIVDSIIKKINDIDMSASYGGRCYTKEENTYIHKISDVKDDIVKLLEKIEDYKIELTV